MSDSSGLAPNPYVGLRPFFFEDSLYFFGRDQQTAELLETLHREQFLAVVGSSGCGKSSMVRAGLIPMLLGGFLVQDRDKWSIVRMKPGDAPMANLAAGLAAIRDDTPASEDAAAIEAIIREDNVQGLVEFVKRQLQPNENVLILVDQFEEIFAYRQNEDDDQLDVSRKRRKERARRRAEAAEFVDLLLRISERRDLPVYVTLTMRTDFLGDCDVFYGLPEAMNRGRYLVPRLGRQQLREAIHGPVLLMMEKIAPRLLDRLLNELGDRSDRLPVLQHALLRTWDAWQADGGVGPIDIRHFDKAGGLEGALSQDAKRAMQGLDAKITAGIFKRLTDTDISQRRVRRPARISELMAVTGASKEVVEEVVDHFRENRRRFLYPSVDGKPDDPRIDMAHESLIRQWEDLRDWVDEERESRDQFLELVDRGRGNRANLQDQDLRFALNWRSSYKPTREWAERYSRHTDDFDVAMAYLDASQKEAEAEAIRERELAEKEKRLACEEKKRLEADTMRRKRMNRVAVAVTAGFAVIAVFAGWQWFEAVQARKGQAEAMGLANASEEVVTNSAVLSGLWEDDGVMDDFVKSQYLALLEPLAGKPEELENTWQRRITALDDWASAVKSTEAVENDPQKAIPEKIKAWQGILSTRSPRIGPDAVRTIGDAKTRVESHRNVLEGSVEIREGTFAVCAADPFCPSTCQGINVKEGKRICVSFLADTHAEDRRESVELEWTHFADDGTTLLWGRRIPDILGRTYKQNQTLSNVNAVAKEGRSEIRIKNRSGDLIFRQPLEVSGS